MDAHDWSDLIEQLVGDIAWPLVVALGVFVFRRELKQAVGRVTRAKVGAAEIELAESARGALVAVGLTEPPDEALDTEPAAAADHDQVSAAELLRYEYARSIVDLAERVLPAGISPPTIGYGSLTSVLQRAPDVPAVMLRVADVADDAFRALRNDDAVALSRATSLMMLIRNVDLYAHQHNRSGRP